MTTKRCEDSEHASISVRELGGEIWSEMRVSGVGATIGWQDQNAIVDLCMGVLARHSGSVLTNDPDMPVTPLPKTES